jgi:hypothetical protein
MNPARGSLGEAFLKLERPTRRSGVHVVCGSIRNRIQMESLTFVHNFLFWVKHGCEQGAKFLNSGALMAQKARNRTRRNQFLPVSTGYRGQEQGGENANDGDRDEQFDQGESKFL